MAGVSIDGGWSGVPCHWGPKSDIQCSGKLPGFGGLRLHADIPFISTILKKD